MPEDVLSAFFASLIAAAATTLVVASAEWLKQRGREARGKRELDIATQRIGFLSALVGLYERVGAAQDADFMRMTVAPQLDAMKSLADQTWSMTQADRQPAFQRAITRILLLGTYRNRVTRGFRALYWITLAWIVIAPGPQFIRGMFGVDTGKPLAYLLGWTTHELVNYLIPELPLLIILRAITLWLIKRETVRTRQAEGSSS